VVVPGSGGKETAQKLLGDRHAADIQPTTFTEPLQRAVKVLVVSVRPTLSAAWQEDTDAVVLRASVPVDTLGSRRHRFLAR
jgi:hypothetical protein